MEDRGGKVTNEAYIRNRIQEMLYQQSPKVDEIVDFIKQIAEEVFDYDRGCGCCSENLTFKHWLKEKA